MKHVQEWCKDHPPIVRMIAKIGVLGCKDLCWGLNKVSQKKFQTKWPVNCPFDKWLSFYYCTKPIRRMIEQQVPDSERRTWNLIEQFWLGLRVASRVPPSVWVSYLQSLSQSQLEFLIARSRASVERVERAMDRQLEELERDQTGIPDHIRDFAATPEAQFFLRVWAPCFTIYGIAPSLLLRNTLRGDLDSCEKLVRLDGSLASHPYIAELAHRSNHAGDGYQANQIYASTLKPPFGRITQWDVIARMGGFVLAIGNLMRAKLNSGDVRKLFLAAEKDFRNGVAAHLQTDNDNFRQALKRAKNDWLDQWSHKPIRFAAISVTSS